MSSLGDVVSGVRTFLNAADDLKSLKAELKLIDSRERDLRQRISYIEGVLANAGAPVQRLRLPRD